MPEPDWFDAEELDAARFRAELLAGRERRPYTVWRVGRAQFFTVRAKDGDRERPDFVETVHPKESRA